MLRWSCSVAKKFRALHPAAPVKEPVFKQMPNKEPYRTVRERASSTRVKTTLRILLLLLASPIWQCHLHLCVRINKHSQFLSFFFFFFWSDSHSWSEGTHMHSHSPIIIPLRFTRRQQQNNDFQMLGYSTLHQTLEASAPLLVLMVPKRPLKWGRGGLQDLLNSTEKAGDTFPFTG